MTPTDPCCEAMRHQLEHTCEDCPPGECPDQLVVVELEEYGLPIRDGGGSLSVIHFCPWCGTRLPVPDFARPDWTPPADVDPEIVSTRSPAKRRGNAAFTTQDVRDLAAEQGVWGADGHPT